MVKTIFRGKEAGEDIHFFICKEKLPFTFYSVGVTYPNTKYFMQRKNIEYYGLEYIISGKGFYEVNGVTYPLQAGDVYIIKPGFSHSYYPSKIDPFKKIWVGFSSEIFIDIIQKLNLNNVFVFHNCFEIEKLFNEIIAIGKTTTSSDLISYNLGLILIEILFFLNKNNNKKYLSNISPLAIQTKQILDASIFKKITISQLDKQLHYSTKQISREFIKVFSTTPYNYLLNNRIEISKKFLLSTNLTIKEISEKLCFNNQHCFSNYFKMKVGESPTSFKNKHK